MANVGVPAEAPHPLDFRSPEHIQELIVYSTGNATDSLQSIFGLRTHPGAWCCPASWVQLHVVKTCHHGWHPCSGTVMPTAGLFFLPSSVSPSAQRSFLEDIAGQLLDPPAATNHTAAHGSLPGLWRAAAEVQPVDRWTDLTKQLLYTAAQLQCSPHRGRWFGT